MTSSGSPRGLGVAAKFACAVATAAAAAWPWIMPLPNGPSPIVGSTLWGMVGMSVMLLAMGLVSAARRPSALATGWVIAAVLSALWGLIQFGDVAHALSEQFSLVVLQPVAVWLAPVLQPAITSTPTPGVTYANLRQPNQFATLMAIGWIASFALLARARGMTTLWLTASAALVGVGNAASGSRTGLLLWILTGAASWIWLSARCGNETTASRDSTKKTIAWAWGSYALALIALPVWADSERHLLVRLVSDAPDCQSRLVLWSNMLHLIAQKPWFGWGWGELDYAHYITAYPGMRFCGLLDNAHNLPLHLAVELGMPVAVLFCAGVVRFVWRRRPWRERDPMRFGAWLILGAIGVHSLLEYPLWYGPFQMTALLCVWMVWRHPEGKGAAGTTQLGRRLMQAAALALSAAAFYAAWDYHRISQLYLPAGQRSAWYAADPWTYARRSWLFADHVRFAELVTTPLTQDNAAHMAQLAEKMLHFSPEPAVVRTLIESLRLLGRDTEAGFHAQCLKDAYAGCDE